MFLQVKGLDFPVEKDEIERRLSGMVVKGKNIEEILEKLEYPVKNPAELLHKIKEKLSH